MAGGQFGGFLAIDQNHDDRTSRVKGRGLSINQNAAGEGKTISFFSPACSRAFCSLCSVLWRPVQPTAAICIAAANSAHDPSDAERPTDLIAEIYLKRHL
jgi:hypothetical protein